jgi:hypothetical protein
MNQNLQTASPLFDNIEVLPKKLPVASGQSGSRRLQPALRTAWRQDYE